MDIISRLDHAISTIDNQFATVDEKSDDTLMHCRVSKLVDYLVQFTKNHPDIDAFILLGTAATQSMTKTSDIDATFVSANEYTNSQKINLNAKFCTLLQKKLKNDHSIETSMIGGNTFPNCFKTIYYVQPDMFKLDVSFQSIESLKSNAKYYICSGIQPSEISKSILYDCSKNKLITQVLTDIVSIGEENLASHCGCFDYDINYHIFTFIESFENCTRNAYTMKNDKYRLEFHLFIMKHSLIIIKCILKNCNVFDQESDNKDNIISHLYLPKNVFEKNLVDETIKELPVTVKNTKQDAFKVCQMYNKEFSNICDQILRCPNANESILTAQLTINKQSVSRLMQQFMKRLL